MIDEIINQRYNMKALNLRVIGIIYDIKNFFVPLLRSSHCLDWLDAWTPRKILSETLKQS